MRVVIDARPLSHPQPGGFKTYVRALATGLRERDIAGHLEESILLYVDRPLAPTDLALLPAQVEVRILDPSRIRTDFWLFRRQLARDAPDIVMGTANYLPISGTSAAQAREVVTIHDAMGIKRYPFVRVHPTLKQRFVNWYWEQMTRLSAARAKRIVTVSESAARELRECMPCVTRDRISVIYNGIVLPHPRPDAALREQNVILALASPDPRKNLSLLYGALGAESGIADLRASRLDIVCTSDISRSRAEAAMTSFGVESYQLLTDLSDQELSDAYARATVFAWPSCREGFGMPPLEAMRCGCPVVSSSAPAMPEILGDAALYFDELDDPRPLAVALIKVLKEESLQSTLSRKGRERAAEFTCIRMAAQTQAVWALAANA